MKKKKYVYPSRNLLSQNITIIVLFLLAVIVSVATIINTLQLEKATKAITKTYVKDVTTQLSNDISERLNQNFHELDVLSSNILLEDKPSLKEMLVEKEGLYDYSSLILIMDDKTVISSNEAYSTLLNETNITEIFENQNHILLLKNQTILYSVPIVQGNSLKAVICGLHAKEKIQELIKPESFSGTGLTCIIDRTGNVIISPKNIEIFQQLDDIFKGNAKEDKATIEAIRLMQENLAQNKDGIFSFIASDETPLILSYDPLIHQDWFLLTLVPSNLITSETSRYIISSIVITWISIAIFIVFVLVLSYTFQKYRKNLEVFAFTDPITLGINHKAFLIQAKQLVSKTENSTYSLVSLDVRNFKAVNEFLGFQEGDAILSHIYRQIKAILKENELCVRFSDDNFNLLLRENEKEAIQERIHSLIQSINAFNNTRETPYFIEFWVGIHIIEDNTVSISRLEDRARTACQHQKYNNLPDYVFYDVNLTKRLLQNQELNALLDKSLLNQDFIVYYQPKVDSYTGEIAGAEALIRWKHPVKGFIYPSDFIPVFEKNGNICKLDYYVFEKTCALIRKRIKQNQPLIPISVNLSRYHFKIHSFLNRFIEIAKAYEIPRNSIEFEITESTMFTEEEIQMVKQSIDLMHENGFQCSLDDFGTGFSSLGLLQEFNVDTIKFDRKFFISIEKSRAFTIITSLSGLTKELNIKTVAEGIETVEQLKMVQKARIDQVQGYYFSKPLPIEEFEEYIQKNKK